MKQVKFFKHWKSTWHFLLQSTVSYRSDSSSKANSSCCLKSDARSYLKQRIVSSTQVARLEGFIRKIINAQWEKRKTKNRTFRNTGVNGVHLLRVPIQSHPSLCVTGKDEVRSKNQPELSQDLSLKKMSMSNLVKRLVYIKCCRLSSHRRIKSPSSFIRYNCQMIYR